MQLHTGNGPSPIMINGPLIMLMLCEGAWSAWLFCVSMLMLLTTWAGVICATIGTVRARVEVRSVRKETMVVILDGKRE